MVTDPSSQSPRPPRARFGVNASCRGVRTASFLAANVAARYPGPTLTFTATPSNRGNVATVTIHRPSGRIRRPRQQRLPVVSGDLQGEMVVTGCVSSPLVGRDTNTTACPWPTGNWLSSPWRKVTGLSLPASLPLSTLGRPFRRAGARRVFWRLSTRAESRKDLGSTHGRRARLRSAVFFLAPLAPSPAQISLDAGKHPANSGW